MLHFLTFNTGALERKEKLPSVKPLAKLKICVHSYSFLSLPPFFASLLPLFPLGTPDTQATFNQNSNRSDREKRTTSKGGPVFSKLFRLDRTDPLSFGPKFPESLVEWIAPKDGFRSILSLKFPVTVSGF